MLLQHASPTKNRSTDERKPFKFLINTAEYKKLRLQELPEPKGCLLYLYPSPSEWKNMKRWYTSQNPYILGVCIKMTKEQAPNQGWDVFREDQVLLVGQEFGMRPKTR